MKSGDYEAFSELLDRHKNKIYALVHRLAGNKENAEDIIQESFLKAIDNIEQFRGESSFGTWLYAIALNQSRAHLAKNQNSELLPIDDYLPHVENFADQPARLYDWQDPQSLLEKRELRQIIDKALSQLPYKYREAFLLRYNGDLSVKEIAEITGESVAATKSRILRARLALRDHLAKVFGEKHGK